MIYTRDCGGPLRFEKVLAFFLDGIPRPFIAISPDTGFGETFGFSSFGIAPDYTGRTEVVYFPEFKESAVFDAICLWRSASLSCSSRIGSHYSPYVGTFCYDGKRQYTHVSSIQTVRKSVRVPLGVSEDSMSTSGKNGRDFRTSLLVSLYESMAKEYITHETTSMRRIVIMATQGTTADHRNVVERTIKEIEQVYISVCTRAIYDYMNLNSLFRRIMAPLRLNSFHDTTMGHGSEDAIDGAANPQRFLAFNTSLHSVKSSLMWSEGSCIFFSKLHGLWSDRFERLVIFNTTTFSWRTDSDDFLSQLAGSMRAAFTRIRVDFYTEVERLLFTTVPEASTVLSMNLADLKGSALWRLFLMIRVFLTNRLRVLVSDAIDDLVSFFTSGGNRVITPLKARRTPLIEVQFVVSGCGLPSSPSFAQLHFGIADLLDELFDSANALPTPETVILRTIKFGRHSLDLFDDENFFNKAALMKYLGEACAVVEDLTEKYSAFASMPTLNGLCFTKCKEYEVINQVDLLRETVEMVGKTSSDVVFFGCIAINCTDVKKWYNRQWSSYLKSFVGAIQKDILSFLRSSVEKCRSYGNQLLVVPGNVEELEKLQSDITYGELLSKQTEANDCRRAIELVGYLEKLLIPADFQLYETATELMRCPRDLLALIDDARKICAERKPVIINQLADYRNELQAKIAVVRTGVVELLGILSVDVSDICAQTCEELRVIVDEVVKGIDHVFYCERSLELETVETFDEVHPMLRTFDILEQFWCSVFDSTRVKDYYKIPVGALNADKIIDDVQRCRRLLHSAVRNLRGYPGLVCLGRQQEQILADFESLQTLLSYLATPGLRKNHWKEIGRVLQLGKKRLAQVDSSVTLRQLLESGIVDHLDEIKLIVDPAFLDFEAETALERMKSEAKKTRFIFEVVEGSVDALVLSPQCRTSICSQLETFLRELDTLRQVEHLSQYTISSVMEFDSVVQRMKQTLLTWEGIEQEWMEVLPFEVTLECSKQEDFAGLTAKDLKLLKEKVKSTNDTFKTLATTLQKAQYTLFTAMMQENIGDQFALARSILGDIRKIIASSLGAKRELFPRFYFLDDESMLSFLCVNNATKLRRYLPALYSRVTDIKLDGNTITSFVAADGSVLRASTSIDISPLPVEQWMESFDGALRSSLLSAIKTSVENHYRMDTLAWLSDSCVQVIDVALRIICHRDLREAVSIAGVVGIGAHARRSKDILEECVRLADSNMCAGVQQILSNAIIFLLQHRDEIRLASKSGIETLEDLRATAMIQTLLESDEITVQLMGIQLPYGMEFFGNYAVPILTPEYVEKGLCSVFLSMRASSFPILVGRNNENSEFEFYAQYLGRFCLFLQCHPTLPFEGVVRALRGCLSTGAILCLKDIELLGNELADSVAGLLENVEFACRSESCRSVCGVPVVEFQAGESSISAARNACFHVVLTTRKLSEIPTALSLAFRPVYVPSVDLVLLAQGTLQALGVPHFMNIGQRLAAMYSQFVAVLPTIFTARSFLSVIQDAVGSKVGTMAENLCLSFARQFWHVIQSDERLPKLFEWNVVHTLGIPQHVLEDVVEQLKKRLESDGLLERFSYFMNFNKNVMLVGSMYSGRTALWKSWVGDTDYVVLSHRLLCSGEVYGDESRHGLLASMAKKWDPTSFHTIVIEHANLLETPTFLDNAAHVRVRPHSGPDFIQGLSTRVITVVKTLESASPRVMSEMSVFVLPDPTDWKALLRSELHRDPDCRPGAAYPVMSALIGAVFDMSSTLRASMPDEDIFSVVYRCSVFYKRWYVFARSHGKVGGERLNDDVFASQCAAFAICWPIMLSMGEKEISTVILAFKKSQDALAAIAQQLGIDDAAVLPPDDDVLSYVATPFGWKKLGTEAADVGFSTPWATGNPVTSYSQHAWTYFLPLRSRRRTLMHVEYLAAVGQSVLLVGERSQGKSTLLGYMRYSNRWAYELIHNTVTCTAGDIQHTVLQGLSRSQRNTYSPSSGQKLVLCVDDVHLVGEMAYPQAMCVFAFMSEYSGLCTPTKGYVPVRNVVCMGTSLPSSSFEPDMENCVLRMRIPDFIEGEIQGEVERLIGGVRGVRRGESFLRGVSDFVIASQGTAFNLINSQLGENHSEVSPSRTMLGSAERVCAFNDASLLSISDQRYAGQLQLPYVYILLRVADRVLRILSTQLDELSVVRGILNSVYTFFVPLITDGSRREELKAELLKAARDTMHYSPDIRQRDSADETYVTEGLNSLECPSMERDVIGKWLKKHDTMMPPTLVDELDSTLPLSYMGKPRVGSPTVKDPQREQDAENRSNVGRSSPWTISLISDLHHCLKQEGSHVALVGPYGIGIRRALHVWASEGCINLKILRFDFTAPDTKSAFTQDLTEILQSTCRGGSRMVVFVPNEVLTLVWPLSRLYYTLRGGDVRQLFSVEEQLYLLHGRRGIHRQTGKLTSAEEMQLRERISTRLSVVAHFASLDEMRRLGVAVPFVLQMLPVTLRAPDMLREHADAVVHGEGEFRGAKVHMVGSGQTESGEGIGDEVASGESARNTTELLVDAETLLDRPYSQLLCDVFSYLRVTVGVPVEQMPEFVTQAYRLRGTLFLIRHEVSQSLKVDELFNSIPIKMQEYARQSKEAKEMMEDVVHNRAALLTKLQRHKECITRHESEWELLQRKARDLLPMVKEAEHALRVKKESIADSLSTTRSRLCTMKGVNIRQYASSLPSPKGVLLMRALCRVLGEDLRTQSAKEVWDRGRSIMTAPKFIVRLRDLDIDGLSYESVSGVHASLRGVRFTDGSPFADALSDYLLSVMEAVRMQRELQVEQMELDTISLEYTTVEDRKNEAGRNISEFRRRMESVEQEIRSMDERGANLEAMIEDMARRQKSLEFITDALDRFSLFHTADKQTMQCSEVSKGEGAVLMVAAHFAFFASLSPEVQRTCHRALYSHLCDLGIQGPENFEDPAASLLFPSVNLAVDTSLLSVCSAYERQCVGALLQKVYSNCPWFCGATSVFEEIVRHCLSFMCGDCVVVSAIQKNFCDEVVRAANSGAGLVVCDVHSPSVLRRLRPLLLALKLLPHISPEKQGLECTLFRREVNIRPTFLMACVSSCVPSREEVEYAARCHVTVINVHVSLRVDKGIKVLLLGCPTAYARTVTENIFTARDKQDNEALGAFRMMLPEVRTLLSGDLDDLAGNRNGKLERVDFLLRELHSLHMAVLRVRAHTKSIQKPLASLWEGLKQGIVAVERAVSIIERRVLGRRWRWDMLEPFIVGATTMPGPYVRRISPSTFDKLPIPQRDFYATTNFVESVVDALACGWPVELRGIFAWYTLSTVVHNCSFVLAHSGLLYSSQVCFLTSQQYEVLDLLLTHPTNADKEGAVRHMYKSSSDSLLNSIASDDFPSDGATSGLSLEDTLIAKDLGCAWTLKEGEELIRVFFHQWMCLNYKACNGVASELYSVFFSSVKRKVTKEEGLSIYDSLDGQSSGLRSSEGLPQFYRHTPIPLLLKGTNMHELAGYVAQRARSVKFSFRYFTVANTRDLSQLMGYIYHLFQQVPVNFPHGNYIMAVFVPPLDVSDEVLLVQAISRKFSTLWRYGIWGLLRNGDPQPQVPVTLFCAVHDASNTCRTDVADVLREWCFPLVLELASPCYHLLSLIGGKVVTPPWKQEGVTLLLEKECTKSEVSYSHLDSCRKGDKSNTVVTPLSYVLELHAGISAEDAIHRSLVGDKGLGRVFATLHWTHINVDDLLLILRLVSLRQQDKPLEEEPSPRRQAVTSPLIASHVVSNAELRSATLQRRSISERLYRFFNKVAFLVYASRREGCRGSLAMENMLYERGPLLMLKDDVRLCYSSVLEEVLREKPTEEVLLETLRRCGRTFLHLCGDVHTVASYRMVIGNTVRRSLYGILVSSEDVSPPAAVDVGTRQEDGAGGNSQTELPGCFPSNSAMSLLLLWEGAYAERTAAALEVAKHSELSSRLRSAITQLRGWRPGSVLRVWLPVLQYPKLLLSVLLADALERKSDLLSYIEAVVVVTRRYTLFHDDVIVVGAVPSLPLEREVSVQSGWEPSEMVWNKASSTRERDMDIVVAIRFRKGLTEWTSRQPSGVLWDLRSGKKDSETRLDGGTLRNNVLFLTEPESPQVYDMEKRSVTTIPVVGLDLQWAAAHPTDTNGPAKEAASRMWRLLFELPLYVIVPARERPHSAHSRGGNQRLANSRENVTRTPAAGAPGVETLNDSLGFFITVE